MKKEPCIKFGIRIRPKISEKPADSRNNSPPYAMLFTAKVNQSDMSDAGPHAPPSPLAGEGWGGGCLFDSADQIPPSRLARKARKPTSPTRGEVSGASSPSCAKALRPGGREISPIPGSWRADSHEHRPDWPGTPSRRR